MSTQLLCQTRIDQTHSELKRLQCELDTWVSLRQKKDVLHQYHTQLEELKGLLFKSLGRIRDGIGALTATGGPSVVYPECRKWDNCLVLARRILKYYRDKFDQRDDPLLQPVLAAADEVVWSCYAEVFRNAGYASIPSAPLPYIEPEYTPLALPRNLIPPGLNAEAERGTDVLKQFLEKMPIPVVALPPASLQAPWQLIYLGHEVGHHVQNDLVPDWKLVGGFGQQLSGASQDVAGKARWKSWNLEVFADVFSVLMMGPAAVRAIVELEITDANAMLQPRSLNATLYPPVIVRLCLLAKLATALGVNGQAILSEYELDPQQVVNGAALHNEYGEDLRLFAKQDLQGLDEIVAAVRRYDLEGRGTFETLCAWKQGKDFEVGEPVDEWTKQLPQRPQPFQQKFLESPRRVVSAAVAVRAQLANVAASKQRKEQMEILRKNLLSTIVACREEGSRAAESKVSTDLDKLGDELGDILFQAYAQPPGG